MNPGGVPGSEPNSDPRTLQLQPATPADAERLLAWRNDADTRAASHHAAPVAAQEHHDWLMRTLADPQRQLWVAWLGGEAVGTVRCDITPGAQPGRVETTLSWTVAPAHRGGGVGRAMVTRAVERLTGPLHAEVRLGNTASARIALAAGLQFDHESQGVIHFRRPA